MGSMTSVPNVVVFPRNGYANRLQAWASAAIVLEWGAPLKVCWEEEAVCPANASSLFRSAGRDRRSSRAMKLTASSVGPMKDYPAI